MNNLLFSLNATLPIFLTMLAGLFFRRMGVMDEQATAFLNRFVFRIALPVLLFEDLSVQDFIAAWNGRFVLFCFLATLVCITLITLFARLIIRDRGKRGEFIQVSYRSSAAILGIAFIQNIYGTGNIGMASLMILGSVPLYNIFAVVVLTLTAEPSEGTAGQDGNGNRNRNRIDRKLLQKTLRGIVTNPILLGIAAGFAWSLLSLSLPGILASTLHNIGVLGTPLGLIAMGAAFDFQKAREDAVPALLASVIKLVLLVAAFMPVAVAAGFRGQELVALLVMFGSASTVSCYIMAKNLGHEGTLTSATVMMTTFGSAFTLTFWLFLLRTLGLV